MAPKTKIEAAPKTSHNRARQHSYPSLSHQMWAWGHLGGPSRHRAPSSHTEPTSSCAERAGSQTKAGRQLHRVGRPGLAGSRTERQSGKQSLKTRRDGAPKTSHNRARQQGYPSLSHQMWPRGHLGGPSQQLHRAHQRPHRSRAEQRPCRPVSTSHTKPASTQLHRAGQKALRAGQQPPRGRLAHKAGWPPEPDGS